ncbi:MAG: 1-deoxy-D-xylulose-5-phosphate reductoisomerase [Negativicutes bacterium]|nr:1-deoxy-D-xylulose-5-phosphate reductoisomerase [Negativicutes bacterium]
MKRISLLGSTGSIGTQTLDVVRAQSKSFQIVALAAYENDILLEEQILEFKPELAVLVDLDAANRLRSRYTGKTEILSGTEGLLQVACMDSADVVLTALVGFAGLEPTLAAIEAGKDIAIANKETLVAAGELVTAKAKAKGVQLLPVDSEHSAIFQALQGNKLTAIEKLIVTASGGALRDWTKEEIAQAALKDVLNHPNWSMGAKVTIDSASLANKGLEVIEAHWLFGIPYDQIEVVVHPQSIIHSAIQYKDGSVIAQLGVPDMKLPILYALSWPERFETEWPRFSFFDYPELTFRKPDLERFPALRLAFQAGRAGGTAGCIFNGANEEAVHQFRQGNISFVKISEMIEGALNSIEVQKADQLETIRSADERTRQWVRKQIKK